MALSSNSGTRAFEKYFHVLFIEIGRQVSDVAVHRKMETFTCRCLELYANSRSNARGMKVRHEPNKIDCNT